MTCGLDNVRAVVFDMDGTLTESHLDFDLIRRESGVPQGRPILEYMEEASAGERRRIEEVLDRHERDAAGRCVLREGTLEVLQSLASRGLRLALLTRNSAESVRVVLKRFGLEFDCWLSRHDAAPKPSPEPVLKIAERLALSPKEMLVVGDYLFDVQSGSAAGSRTAFLRTRPDLAPPEESDFVIDDLRELLELIPAAAEAE